jgi:transcriptional regulator with XRE-family HTH domain
MEKSTFTPLYEHFRRKLVEMRQKVGLTQRGLAKRLKREHSFVSRIEQGERRLDVVEYFWVIRACGRNPERTAAELMRQLARLEPAVDSRADAKRGRQPAQRPRGARE